MCADMRDKPCHTCLPMLTIQMNGILAVKVTGICSESTNVGQMDRHQCTTAGEYPRIWFGRSGSEAFSGQMPGTVLSMRKVCVASTVAIHHKHGSM